MKPTTCFRSLPLFFAACLALLAALSLATDGRAAQTTSTIDLALTGLDGNIQTSPIAVDSASPVTIDWESDSYPALSPNGQQIVFVRGTFAPDGQKAHELLRINADGSGLQRLTHNDLIESWPTWSPRVRGWPSPPAISTSCPSSPPAAMMGMT